MHDTEVYRDLGYESFTEYVAQPELGMRKSWAYAVTLAAELVQATSLDRRDISGEEVTKLAMVSRQALRALEVGDRHAAVALVEEAKVLSRSDLRAPHEDGERDGELEEEARAIQKLLVETVLGRKIEAIKYDGYTFMLLTHGAVWGLQQQVRVCAPAGLRLSVKLGSVSHGWTERTCATRIYTSARPLTRRLFAAAFSAVAKAGWSDTMSSPAVVVGPATLGTSWSCAGGAIGG
ncbi:MAG TPA: hypothetical protein VKZ50_09440 [bacterium]|nr:hypothetical protein [bacterium]